MKDRKDWIKRNQKLPNKISKEKDNAFWKKETIMMLLTNNIASSIKVYLIYRLGVNTITSKSKGDSRIYKTGGN